MGFVIMSVIMMLVNGIMEIVYQNISVHLIVIKVRLIMVNVNFIVFTILVKTTVKIAILKTNVAKAA